MGLIPNMEGEIGHTIFFFLFGLFCEQEYHANSIFWEK